jgi:hypothetical protein
LGLDVAEAGNPAVSSRRKKRNSGNGDAPAKKKRKPEQVDWSAWTSSWAPEARTTLGDIWPEHAMPKPATDPPERK